MNIFNYINLILEILLKLISVIGLFWLFFKYYQVIKIDREIKDIAESKTKKELEKLRTDNGVISATSLLGYDFKDIDLKEESILLNNLKEKRKDIISLIPFIK